LSTIQNLTGTTWKYIKQAVTKPESIIPGKCPCRYCPAKELTQEEVDFAVETINNKPRKILKYKTALEVARACGIIKNIKSERL
jgi:hypothetical protein